MSNIKRVGEKLEGAVAGALWDLADDNASSLYDLATPRDAAAGAGDTVAAGVGDVVRAVFTGRPALTMAEFYAKWEEENARRSSEPVMWLHSMAFVTPNHTPYYSHAGLVDIRHLPTYLDHMNATGTANVTVGGRTVPRTADVRFLPIAIAADSAGRVAVMDAVTTHGHLIHFLELLGRDVPAGLEDLGGMTMVNVLKPIGDETCGEPPCVDLTLGPFRDGRAPGSAHDDLSVRPSVAVDSLDRIIVTEAGTGLVHVFHPNGTPALAFGGKGSGPGEFAYPSRVAAGPNDRIFVSDPGNDRLQIFDPDGSFAAEVRSPPSRDGQYPRPVRSTNPSDDAVLRQASTTPAAFFNTSASIAVDPGGSIVAVSARGAAIKIFGPDGAQLREIVPYGGGIGNFLYGGHGVAIDSLNRITLGSGLGSADDAKVISYDMAGRFIEEVGVSVGTGPTSHGRPMDIAVDPDGRLLVADMTRARINVFELDADSPGISNVYYGPGQGGGRAGGPLDIMVNFTEAVTVTGRPSLMLDMDSYDRPAQYASGSGSPVLRFSSGVWPCDSADPLRYAGSAALALNGGEIIDGSGNAANLTLPPPGGPGSLSAGAGAAAVRLAPAADAGCTAGGGGGENGRPAPVAVHAAPGGHPLPPHTPRLLAAGQAVNISSEVFRAGHRSCGRRRPVHRAAHGLARHARLVRVGQQHGHAVVCVHGARLRRDIPPLVRRRVGACPQRQPDRRPRHVDAGPHGAAGPGLPGLSFRRQHYPHRARRARGGRRGRRHRHVRLPLRSAGVHRTTRPRPVFPPGVRRLRRRGPAVAACRVRAAAPRTCRRHHFHISYARPDQSNISSEVFRAGHRACGRGHPVHRAAHLPDHPRRARLVRVGQQHGHSSSSRTRCARATYRPSTPLGNCGRTTSTHRPTGRLDSLTTAHGRLPSTAA